MTRTFVWALALCTAPLSITWAADDFSLFREKIEPLLEKHCYECHSAKAEKIKGGLWLDSKEGILKGGDTGTALVPGDPDNSKIIIAVRHNDPDLQMPPKKKISDEEIATLEQWVKAGAPDPRVSPAPAYKPQQELWSTQPIQSPPVPPVKNPEWVRDPMDAFVLATLESKGLSPVARADDRTLIRRASFDLLGLPPEPEKVERLLAEGSATAYARFVEEALKSPHFGERWGRHWLDLARYADSNGPDNTRFENAWRYRDWVINAFNTDKPYDEFIREQLAGDLLPATSDEDRHQKWIATGFLMIGPKNFFEPNREKLLMDIADEQIDVTSRAFLGLTVSCARCHDHKFDPIPTRDYYALAGIFKSTQTLASDARRAPDGSRLSQRGLGTAEQIAAFEKFQAELQKLQARRNTARRLAQELPGGIDSKELDGIVLDNLQAEVVGNWKLSKYSTNFVDQNYLHDGNDRRGKGEKLVRFRPDIPRDGAYEIRLAYTARYDRASNVPVRVQAPNGSMRTVHLNQQVLPPFDKAFETLGIFMLEKGTNNTIEVLTEGTKGFVVVDAVQFLPQDVQLAASLMKKRSTPEPEESMMTMMDGVSAAELAELEYKIMEFEAQPPPEIADGLPRALAVRDLTPVNAKIHVRGDPERLGDEVPRGFLSVVEHVETGKLGTDSSGRLELANWIASEQNPLTARVAVNRIWLHLFGRGLVNTPDNFGSLGERPTHPELLDYLAAEFMREGWSTRRMIRRIMLSSTYQLSTALDEKAHAIDPENWLHSRMNRKRLDAESLRDAILAVNSTLDRTAGGDTLNAAAPNGPPGAPQEFKDLKRRSLYLPVLRGSVNELFQFFDFPDPSALAAKRYVTTAPTQALYLMNSEFISENSRAWAEMLLANSGKSDAELINDAYALAYNRPCSIDEQKRALEFLKNFERGLVQVEADAAARKKRAVQAFCQALIESTEFRFLN